MARSSVYVEPRIVEIAGDADVFQRGVICVGYLRALKRCEPLLQPIRRLQAFSERNPIQTKFELGEIESDAVDQSRLQECSVEG